jgi:D-serine deaminase-like pyridoxal phosphate-dependent protein
MPTMPAALSSPEVPTPALIVDAAVLRANIEQMAARARSAGADLWPHVKTHKSGEVARLQLAAGAAGLTAATITEAEAMADAGAADLLVAYPPPDRVIFDAGSKALSSDQLPATPGGYGTVLGEPAISIGRLYEEHAIARLPRDLDLPIGSRVRIVPNHACVAANMHRTMLMLDRGSVAAEWATGSAGWS